MADVFISYKSERRPAARHLASIIEAHGYDVWFDYDLVPGKNFGAHIERELRAAKAVLVLWCSRSVQSDAVQCEAQLAKELGLFLPARIEAVRPPMMFSFDDYVDLANWDGDPRASDLDRLIDCVEKLVGREANLSRRRMVELHTTWVTHGRPTLPKFALGPARDIPDEDRRMPTADAKGRPASSSQAAAAAPTGGREQTEDGEGATAAAADSSSTTEQPSSEHEPPMVAVTELLPTVDLDTKSADMHIVGAPISEAPVEPSPLKAQPAGPLPAAPIPRIHQWLVSEPTPDTVSVADDGSTRGRQEGSVGQKIPDDNRLSSLKLDQNRSLPVLLAAAITSVAVFLLALGWTYWSAAVDDEAFAVAEKTGTAAAYHGYLLAYPRGHHAATARDTAAMIEARDREDIATQAIAAHRKLRDEAAAKSKAEKDAAAARAKAARDAALAKTKAEKEVTTEKTKTENETALAKVASERERRIEEILKDPRGAGPGVNWDRISSDAVAFQRAADRDYPNDPRLWFALGRALEKSKDHAGSYRYYEKAAQRENGAAMDKMGAYYETRKDFITAKSWYEKAAKAGNGTGMNNLGVLYEWGRGVDQSYSLAREWYEKAAAAGDETALKNLADLYKKGWGVAGKDLAKAKSLYLEAFEKGEPSALLGLGAMYKEEKDFENSRIWYENAAADGSTPAMIELGLLYREKGLGVENVGKAYDSYLSP